MDEHLPNCPIWRCGCCIRKFPRSVKDEQHPCSRPQRTSRLFETALFNMPHILSSGMRGRSSETLQRIQED